MGKDIEMYEVVDGEIDDETCELAGYPCCPGGPAPLVVDPYDEDVNNTRRMARLHDECAHERAMDI